MNDDTLVLYYYNDGLSDRERRQVEAALNSDPAVAARYEALCRQLNDMVDPALHAVPAHTLQR
jgi:anti-sigma factor RsiW